MTKEEELRIKRDKLSDVCLVLMQLLQEKQQEIEELTKQIQEEARNARFN